MHGSTDGIRHRSTVHHGLDAMQLRWHMMTGKFNISTKFSKQHANSHFVYATYVSSGRLPSIRRNISAKRPPRDSKAVLLVCDGVFQHCFLAEKLLAEFPSDGAFKFNGEGCLHRESTQTTTHVPTKKGKFRSI